MPIPPQVVVSLFFFIAASFPDQPSPTAIDIPELVTRAKNGDRSAVALLYQIHSQRIFRYIVTRVPTVADAEDLTAEVFVRMVKGLPNYEISGAPFEAWLYRIATTRVTDFYRDNSRHAHTELDETWSDSAPLPEEQILHNQGLDQLRTALQRLPEDQQLILILRFVERKSHEDVAQILGKSVQAVKSAQHRALIHLTELMGSKQKARHYLRGSHE
jgi:RNA polymerase sigma-70 factor (ECF subfamily)